MGFLVKMAEIRSVGNTSSRHFHVLLYNIKHISITPVVFFFKSVSLGVLKKVVAKKWLNTEAVWDI